MEVRYVRYAIPLFFLFTGCASIDSRSKEYGYYISPGIYPGVRTDVKQIGDIAKGRADPFIQSAAFIVMPVSLLDVPFSFVLDTLLLPYDISKNSKNKESETDSEVEIDSK